MPQRISKDPKFDLNVISVVEAYALLEKLGAPSRLIKHSKLVHEVAQELVQILERLQFQLDANLVEIGAVLHDIGKISHPEELFESGTKHEIAGKSLLIKNGLSSELAQFPVSHSNWRADTSTEELIVALADKLWKGKRTPELEQILIEWVSVEIDREYWALFALLDTKFEEIANNGDDRLRKSQY